MKKGRTRYDIALKINFVIWDNIGLGLGVFTCYHFWVDRCRWFGMNQYLEQCTFNIDHNFANTFQLSFIRNFKLLNDKPLKNTVWKVSITFNKFVQGPVITYVQCAFSWTIGLLETAFEILSSYRNNMHHIMGLNRAKHPSSSHRYNHK